MEIILVSASRGALGRLPVERPAVLAGLTAALAATVYLALGAYGAAVDEVAARILEGEGGARQRVQREVVAQRRDLRELEQDLGSHLDALGRRLGVLQAHVTRLDALGERLRELGGLPAAEFDFEAPPALGGPAPAPGAGGVRSTRARVLGEAIERFAASLREKEHELAGLESMLVSARLQHAVQPAGRPIREGWMSSAFGYRADPVTGKREFHRGIDFSGRRGSDVVAVAAGVVTHAARKAGYGNMVEINHGNGLVTRYSHNKRNLVEVGDKVGKNQVIANMGSTGRSTGPHVHFEVIRDGKFVNPIEYIRSAAR